MTNKNLYKLLLVDDDQIIRMIYQHTFEKYFDTIVASSGEEALELLMDQRFDAILTDINMPEMCGIELTKKIRCLTTANSQALIMGVTANAEMYRDEAVAAGMSVVFAKPVIIKERQNYLNKVF